jgi:hypothetical protein
MPRGLVRHGLNEGSDSFLSSFVYLIFILLIFLILRIYKIKKRFIILIFGFYFMVVAFKFPDVKDFNSLFESFNINFKDYKPLNKVAAKLIRYHENKAFANENYIDFKNFMDNNFEKTATFIDFSNTPMLYFYTQRRVPSYFPQYMQNTVDNYLQQANLASLKNYQIPVVVFSNAPNTLFDNIDNVPNAIRYSKIAEYIYQNYLPYANISKHEIWIKKHHKLLINKPDKLSYLTPLQSFNIMKLPYVEYNLTETKPYDQILYQWNRNQISLTANYYYISLPTGIDKESGNYLIINFKRKYAENQKFKMVLLKDSIESGNIYFDILNKKETESYAIRISSLYSWYSVDNNIIRLYFENDVQRPEIISIQLSKAN